MKALLALAFSTLMLALPAKAQVGRECDFSKYPEAQNAESRAKVAAQEWAAYSLDKKKGQEQISEDARSFSKDIKGASNEEVLVLALKFSLAEGRLDRELRASYPLATCFEQATKYPVLKKRFFETVGIAYLTSEGIAAVHSGANGMDEVLMFHRDGMFKFNRKSEKFYFWSEENKSWMAAKNDEVEVLNSLMEKLSHWLGLN